MKNTVLLIIKLLILLFILSYILELDKNDCHCSNTWEKRYIKYYIYFVIGLTLVLAIFAKFSIKLLAKNLPIVVILLTLLSISFVASIFLYIRRMKETRCECSMNTNFQILDFINKIQILYFIYFFIVLFWLVKLN
jgi:hypothetical protein